MPTMKRGGTGNMEIGLTTATTRRTRPRVSANRRAVPVSVSIRQNLVMELERMACERNTSRSHLVAVAITDLLERNPAVQD
jgi:hypothetical protein